MKISKRCQLFVFAILIGLAAVLLPYAASASPHVLTCGKTSFRLNELAGTVSHRGADGRWGAEIPLRVSYNAFRWEVKTPAAPQVTDYYLIERESLEFTYRRCSGNDCAGGESICMRQSNQIQSGD